MNNDRVFLVGDRVKTRWVFRLVLWLCVASGTAYAGILPASPLPPIEIQSPYCPHIEYVIGGDNEAIGYTVLSPIDGTRYTIILSRNADRRVELSSTTDEFPPTSIPLVTRPVVLGVNTLGADLVAGNVVEHIKSQVGLVQVEGKWAGYLVFLYPNSSLVSFIVSLDIEGGAICSPAPEGMGFSSFNYPALDPVIYTFVIPHRIRLHDLALELQSERAQTESLVNTVENLSASIVLSNDKLNRTVAALEKYYDLYQKSSQELELAIEDTEWLKSLLLSSIKKTKAFIKSLNKGDSDKARKKAISSLQFIDKAVKERAAGN